MLPSMPILFSRESQDAFGNKIEPSTSFFSQHSASKPLIIVAPEPPPDTASVVPIHNEAKAKKESESNKKNNPPNVENDDNVLESALVRSYYQRVQSRFSSNLALPTNKFVQFQNILRNFNPNQETPVELYKKIEVLFGEEHKDIAEDFLLFLKPGQAAQAGRFMDRFMMVQISAFIGMLHTTFARKPTVLRKVIRAITTGLNTGNSAEMKARVLPHLRSNTRLAQMFRDLFPDERPPNSSYECGVGVLNESFLTNDRGYDVWEFEEENEKKRKLNAKEGLDTLYLNGRVYLQHGRLVRSARVSFPFSKEPYRAHARRLAPAHFPSPPDSGDDLPAKSKPKRTRKQKSPTKKDVNDNTKSPKPKKSQNKRKKDKEQKRSAKSQKKEDGPKEPRLEAVLQRKKMKIDAKSSWTRDEDKTMLEVMKGGAGSEMVLSRIRELLPHRSPTEIKERFCHVMTLLQQMAVGEIT